MVLEWLAEQRIQAAIRAGELDNLPGAHKPLPPDLLDPLIPAHLRAAMRVIGNSGGTPSEVLMRCELARINTQIAQHSHGNSTAETNEALNKLHEKRLELLISLRIAR